MPPCPKTLIYHMYSIYDYNTVCRGQDIQDSTAYYRTDKWPALEFMHYGCRSNKVGLGYQVYHMRHLHTYPISVPSSHA